MWQSPAWTYRRPLGADAEFDDPVRQLRPVAAAVFLFGPPLLQSCDLAVDALQPEDV
jgi:hypothetical protein